MKMRRNKKKTIGVMTQSRGTMPPPTAIVKNRKGAGSYNRQEAKRVDY